MKKSLLTIALLGVFAARGDAGTMLLTSNPPGTPLIVTAGSTSGAMLISVVSDTPGQDIMSAWNFALQILPDAGAAGTLAFQEPASGTPPNPPDYLFGVDGIGIAVTNVTDMLSANDFYAGSGSGVSVPSTPGANLLQVNFVASASAFGVFGIYALEGAALTQWTDGNATTQFFTNVPDGTGMVRIGEVLVVNVIPEPPSLALGGTAALLLACGFLMNRFRTTAFQA